MNMYVKGFLFLGILTSVYYVWDNDREHYAKTKVDAVVAGVKKAADEDWKAKLKLYADRLQSQTSDLLRAEEALKQLKGLNDEKDNLIANRDRINAGLRSTLVRTRTNEISADPGSTCKTQELRSERLASLLEEGQRRCVQLAETAGVLEGLVLTCETGARTDAVMFRWALDTIESNRLGTEPPQAP